MLQAASPRWGRFGSKRARWFAGSALVLAVVLLSLSLRTWPDEYSDYRAFPTWDRIKSPFLSPHVAGRVGLNDGTVDLEYNEFWRRNWNESTLAAATRRKQFDPWARHADLPPEQYKSRKETIASLRQLLNDLPLAFPYTMAAGLLAQNRTLHEVTKLLNCLERDTCKPGQTRIIIANWSRFCDYLAGDVSGENIWARSSIDAFQDLGHTVLFAYGTLETLMVYRAMPNLVSNIIMDGDVISACAQAGIPRPLTADEIYDGATVVTGDRLSSLQNQFDVAVGESTPEQAWGWPRLSGDASQDSTECVMRLGVEGGIPIWKLHALHWWTTPSHPLGAGFTSTPESYSTHPAHRNKLKHMFYLGYSIEKWCKQYPRFHPTNRLNQVYVLAKEIRYFGKELNAFYGDGTFADMKNTTGLTFLTGAGNEDDVLPDPGLTNIGRTPVAEFQRHLAESKALIGLGQPWVSPTPYDALCLGVPFIVPLDHWDEDDPTNRNDWSSQHDGLLFTTAPYVYHVRAGDIQGLSEAVQHAVDNPIDVFIVPPMTIEANRRRHQAFVNLDWRILARTLIAEMQAEGIASPFLV